MRELLVGFLVVGVESFGGDLSFGVEQQNLFNVQIKLLLFLFEVLEFCLTILENDGQSFEVGIYGFF